MSDGTTIEQIETIVFLEILFSWTKMASAGEMSLNDTANVIPWFATGRTGAHIGNSSLQMWQCVIVSHCDNALLRHPLPDLADLNTIRDWRKDPEDGITEDDIHAPLNHQHTTTKGRQVPHTQIG